MKFAAVWLLVTGVFLVGIGATQTTPSVFDWWEPVLAWALTCIIIGLIGVANILYEGWWRG